MSPIYDQPRFNVMAENGLLVAYGNTIDPQISRRVQAVKYALEEEQAPGIIEVVPAYCSVLIVYDALTITCEDLKKKVVDLDDRLTQMKVPEPDNVVIPVCYGDAYGPDLKRVASHNVLGEEVVIRLHCEPAYPIYMLGFAPGFPFLGGLSEKLFTPRLDSPRTSVPAGSVGIANNQTGIYPIESPGGWQLIGRTPVKLFDPGRKAPFLLKSGDRLKFKPISAEEFNRLVKEN